MRLSLPRSDPRRRTFLVVMALAAGLLVFTQFLLPGPKGSGGRGTPMAVLFEYSLEGLLAGITGAGIVLIYRSQRFINFAAGGIGAAGATLTVLFVLLTKVPFFVALPLGLALGVLCGVLFELVFVRRFFNAPRLTLTVVSVAAVVAVELLVVAYVVKLPFFPRLSSVDPSVLEAPVRTKLPFAGFHFQIGGLPLRFGFADVFAIELVIVVLAGLAWFFRYTRAGIAVRALSENPERAELLGISTRTLSTVVWGLAGLLSAAGAIALTLVQNTNTANTSSTVLVIPLAAAVVGRMKSIAACVAAAVGVSVLSGAILYSYPAASGPVSAVQLGVLAAALFLQRRTLLRSEGSGDGGWEAADEVRAIPKELAGIPSVRAARYGVVAVALAVLAFLPFAASGRFVSLMAQTALLGIAAMSVVVLTGWAGQVSLGQYAFVGIAAVVGGSLVGRAGWPFWIAVPVVVVFTALLAALVGLPALRVRGLYLAAITFALAVTVSQFLFDRAYFDWLLPNQVGRPRLFFLDFADERSMYFLCVAGLIIAAVVALNLRRSRFGRILIALRDNEQDLQAAGVSVVRTKIMAFAAAGALAGLAGVLYAVQQRGVDGGSFSPDVSLSLFLYVILGGVTSVAGGVLGVTAYFTFQQLAQHNSFWSFLLGFAPLLVLWIQPSGIIGIVTGFRDGLLRVIAQRRQIVVPSLFADYDAEALARRLVPLAPPGSTSGLSALGANQRYQLPSALHGRGGGGNGKPTTAFRPARGGPLGGSGEEVPA